MQNEMKLCWFETAFTYLVVFDHFFIIRWPSWMCLEIDNNLVFYLNYEIVLFVIAVKPSKSLFYRFFFRKTCFTQRFKNNIGVMSQGSQITRNLWKEENRRLLNWWLFTSISLALKFNPRLLLLWTESLALLLEVRVTDGDTSMHLLTLSNESCVTVIFNLNSWKLFNLLSQGLHRRCGKSSFSRLRPYISSVVESRAQFPFAKIFLKWTSPVNLHNLQQPSLCKFFSASEDLSHLTWPAKHEASSRITHFVDWWYFPLSLGLSGVKRWT